jgi:hypothetical protein
LMRSRVKKTLWKATSITLSKCTISAFFLLLL